MSMAIDEIIKMKDKDVTNQMYLTLHFEQKWFLVTEKNCFRNLSITERKKKDHFTFIFLKCMNLFSMPFAKHMCKYFCIS